MLALLCAAPAAARPFTTEEVSTLGKLVFETGIAGSYRTDQFKSPKTDYETVTVPFDMKIGLHRFVDFGFHLTYLSQTLDGNTRYTGSRTALFSPELKISPSPFFGTLFIWHARAGDEPKQELPIARGNDYEVRALFARPGRFPLNLNVGYVWKGEYQSRQGVSQGATYKIHPGDIFETSASAELPVKWGLSLIGEGAYYHVNRRTINGVQLDRTNGSAADASIGINWKWHSWDIGTAVAFGLLNEQFTSFDLERGAGDVTYKWQAHYRLNPHKPESYE